MHQSVLNHICCPFQEQSVDISYIQQPEAVSGVRALGSARGKSRAPAMHTGQPVLLSADRACSITVSQKHLQDTKAYAAAIRTYLRREMFSQMDRPVPCAKRSSSRRCPGQPYLALT